MNATIIALAIVCLAAPPVDEAPTICGKTAEEWVAVLQDKTRRPGDRQQAVRMLVYFGPAAKAAVPDLIAIVKEKGYWGDAIEALGRIGPDAVSAVPILVDKVRAEGCNLARTGAFGETIRGNPKFALARIGAPAVPALMMMMDDPDEFLRPCAANILARMGPEAKVAVPALTRLLQREATTQVSIVLRSHAVIALGSIGPEAKSAIPSLEGLLFTQGIVPFDQPDQTLDPEVIHALDRLGSPPLAKMLDALLKGDPGVAYELGLLGPRAKSLAPSLRSALSDERLQIRIDAASALIQIDPTARESMPVLIDALENHSDEAFWVPEALRRAGPAAKDAIPALAKLVEAGQALAALLWIDPEGRACVPALISALKSDEADFVAKAANGLGLVGPRAKEAVPALIGVLSRKFGEPSNGIDPQVSAVWALGRIGTEPKDTLPALIAALKHRRPAARGIDDKEEPEPDDSSVAQAAAEVLGSLGPEAKAAVPALIDALLTHEREYVNQSVREVAARALGRIGPDARAAVPALQDLAKKERDSLGTSAKVALIQLGAVPGDQADAWITASMNPEFRARLLGATGRTSFEADAIIRLDLERLEESLAADETECSGHELEYLGWRFDRLGLFGVGGRVAIPRLEELGTHRNPWIRLFSVEALRRIKPKQ
jgi:HEAT repeat protein